MRSPYVLIPLLLFFLIYTTYKLRQVFPKRRGVTILVVLAVTLALSLSVASQFVYRSLAGADDLRANGFLVTALLWVGGFILGLLATFWLLALMLDVVRLLQASGESLLRRHRQSIAGDNLSAFPTNPQRRLFLGKSLSTAALAGSAGMATIGLAEVAIGPDVKKVSILLPQLHPDLQGLRIAQISDLHVGPTVRKNYVSEVVAKVLELKADIIAITGDLADGKPIQLEEDLKPLAQLRARHGVFYITGNHEFYWGAPLWIQKARDLGFTPLLNENVVVPVGAAKLLVAGVTDTSAEQFSPEQASDPKKSIQSTQTADCKILLAHRPDSCYEAAPAGFDFQMSGHTHAGQFFPFSILVSFAHKYFRGLYKHEGMWLYVNSGTGYWGPPNRFTVPSEITLFELHKLAPYSADDIVN